MVRALTAGVSGIQQFQTKLDVIGNNIANSNTVAYKSSRALFEDSFSDALNTSMQVGSGVQMGSVQSLFANGSINKTGQVGDMAIAGQGFFVVKNPQTGEEFATRAGSFQRNSEGYLVTSDGYRLQGFNNSGFSSMGDIKVAAEEKPATAKADAAFAGYTVEGDGKIKVKLTDGTQYYKGQVLLQTFNNPTALVKEANNLYSGLALAGPLAPQPQAPKTNGLGAIEFEALEGSNVDLTTEFASLITTQRGFQANARVITTTDEMLQEVVNLKR